MHIQRGCARCLCIWQQGAVGTYKGHSPDQGCGLTYQPCMLELPYSLAYDRAALCAQCCAWTPAYTTVVESLMSPYMPEGPGTTTWHRKGITMPLLCGRPDFRFKHTRTQPPPPSTKVPISQGSCELSIHSNAKCLQASPGCLSECLMPPSSPPPGRVASFVWHETEMPQLIANIQTVSWFAAECFA